LITATALYEKLNRDFIREGITDYNWAARMPGLDQYLYDNFKRCGMGLMCDFAKIVQKVYTTVFLSDRVLSKILSDNVSDALIFSHHPTNWDIARHDGNYAATEAYITRLRDRNIAIYVLHHPLDNYGDYSTCKTLATRLNMNMETPAFLYCGALCGVIGTVGCETIGALYEAYTNTLGHKTSLYQYGKEDMRGEKIAVCPGGGNAPFVIHEMLDRNIKILVTGVTIVNERSKETHAFEKENGISVLGGTHYSTEKFAPIEMCGYFGSLGLPAEFVGDAPDFYDL